MKLVIVNYAFDARIESPDALLDAYHTLTGWSDAAVGAGLSVQVVQAFTRNATVRRGAVDYRLCESAGRRSYAARTLHATVVASHPDVVHVNGLDVPLQTALLRRALPGSTALVVQDHGGVPSGRLSVAGAVRRRAMRAADGYLFTSRAQARPWVQGGFIGREADVYDVLEASTHMRPIDRATARRVTGMTGAPAVLWVARLDANKDPLTVLAGFEQALAAIPDATLTMAYGGDVLLPAVRQRIAASTLLADRVRLVGAIPHARLAAWYSAADVFVIGSAREGSGYALLEACACGALPVVTDIAPFRAITGNASIGLHWPVGDVGALAEALITAGRRELEQERRGVLHHFARHLSWDVVGRRACHIYERVCEARLRGASR